MFEINDIGGWPKLLEKNPARPHDILGDEYDDSDLPWEIHWYRHVD